MLVDCYSDGCVYVCVCVHERSSGGLIVEAPVHSCLSSSSSSAADTQLLVYLSLSLMMMDVADMT